MIMADDADHPKQGTDMKKLFCMMASGAVLAMSQGALAQEAPLYPYEAGENNCPSGMQPVTMNGVICCGVPNQAQSYQELKRHAVYKSTRTQAQPYVNTTRIICPEGAKGCYTID